MSDLFYFKI